VYILGYILALFLSLTDKNTVNIIVDSVIDYCCVLYK